MSKTVNWFIITLSVAKHKEQPELIGDVDYITGQQEIGEGGFKHWQFVCHITKKSRCSALQKLWPSCHAEPTRSDAALTYCQKEETRVPGTQFTLGVQPINRCSKTDWDRVRKLAETGDVASIPSDIALRYYANIKSIGKDHATPQRRPDMEALCFWGVSNSGKSFDAMELAEAGSSYYMKDPRTKWWDGYRGQEVVVIDEFTGDIAINHMLRWLDKLPCLVECKGGAIPLSCKKIIITSNVDPRHWYADINEEQLKGLMRRMKVVHYPNVYKC